MEIIKGFPATSQDDYQLNMINIIKHGARNFGKQQIVTRKADGSMHRYTYQDAYVLSAKTSWTEKCATTSWTKFFDNRITTTSFHDHRNKFGGVHGRGKQAAASFSRRAIQGWRKS